MATEQQYEGRATNVANVRREAIEWLREDRKSWCNELDSNGATEQYRQAAQTSGKLGTKS
jgi:hypothetical protein